ncbi:zinc ion binding protein [Thalictrum thalictroides]|uniref:Zinc finger protein 830 n=1 Tax=Thalictrum thalictroides TaxID=46969 RepID=A0A7J6WI57_THATH|nr:zinc ion binding protein [Thalictrum thalictroides]
MDPKKAIYRAKLKEAAAQKRDKRIDSPLVRYNENDQPICRVCDVVLKSESLWAAHQASRKHHEAITKLRANAAGQAQNVTKSETPADSMHKTRPASTLHEGFFDKDETKRQKTGLGTAHKIEADTLKGSVKSLDSASPEKIHGKTKGSFLSSEVPTASSEWQRNKPSSVNAINAKEAKESTGSNHHSHTTQRINSGAKRALPEGFFDSKDAEATTERSGSEVKQVKGTLPDGFFDNKDLQTTANMDDSEIKQSKGSLPEGFFDNEDASTNRKPGGTEVKQVKGALPEGFFDNKDADLRARGIEPVKVDIKDEYKEFEKLIQEDLQEVDLRYEEEEVDAADDRQVEETFEQKAYRERVEMLKKKQLELKAARTGGQKSSKLGKDSSDDDSSSDEDNDDKENFSVDWRAMHL